MVINLSTLISPPLAAHFIWHPADFILFEKICGQFHRYLTRDIERPFSRELNIPTFFYSSSGEVPKDIPSTFAQKNIIFVCVSMNTLANSGWREYLNRLPSDEKNYPIVIALDELGLKHSGIGGALENLNFIRAYKFSDEYLEKQAILFLSHELFRFGFGDVLNAKVGVDASIQLFLSHAKNGGTGEIYAKAIKSYIDETNMNNFFDASEISVGYKFDEEIIRHINKSTLISITTDEYSSRYWCQREILEAKKQNRPIISVNCLQIYEDRIFPPSGNVPCVHITPNEEPLEEEILNILIAALLETIRFRYSESLLEYYKNLGWIDKSAIVFARPPEIQQIVNLKELQKNNNELIVCYPEPPIYAEEMDWVNFLNVKVSTPLWSNSRVETKNLRVGISISNIDEIDFNKVHLHPDELKRFSQELARHLLVNDNTLIYGGDLRAGGFTEFILEEASILKTRLPDRSFVVENHLAWPLNHLPEALEHSAKYFDVLKQIQHIPPDEFIAGVNGELLFKDNTIKNRNIFSSSLRLMREGTIAGSDVRIMAGGKTRGYKGFMPGVLEEFYIALKFKKPIFLVGGYGGVVGDICHSILSNKISETLTMKWQAEQDSSYLQFIEYSKNEMQSFSYDCIHSAIRELTVEDLAVRSGLLPDEYKRLMSSQFMDEIIHLILKGLTRIRKIQE